MSPSSRGTDDVAAFLRQHQVDFEIRTFDSPTRTAQESAAQLGIELGQIIKTLCFVADEQPVLVLCPGPGRVSMKKLKAISGCKKLPTARPEQILLWTGFAVGSVNPFFENATLPVLCDLTVLEPAQLWFGAGAPNALVRVPSVELARVLRMRVVDVRE